LVGDVWGDVPDMMHAPASERTGYPTQKPLALLTRIIESCTAPGGLVADFFCGSGTALAAAEQSGRRWIGCDQSTAAIETAVKRLSSLPGHPPFVLYRAGA
jgi:DNA modification methylase